MELPLVRLGLIWAHWLIFPKLNNWRISTLEGTYLEYCMFRTPGRFSARIFLPATFFSYSCRYKPRLVFAYLASRKCSFRPRTAFYPAWLYWTDFFQRMNRRTRGRCRTRVSCTKGRWWRTSSSGIAINTTARSASGTMRLAAPSATRGCPGSLPYSSSASPALLGTVLWDFRPRLSTRVVEPHFLFAHSTAYWLPISKIINF